MTQRSVLSTSLALVLTLYLALPATLGQMQIPEKPLTNAEVVGMVKANLPTETIIATILVSRCHFDTNPSVLAELKYRGVPDAILIAMAEAPYGAPKKSTPQSLGRPPKELDVTAQSSDTKNEVEPVEHKADNSVKVTIEAAPPPV